MTRLRRRPRGSGSDLGASAIGYAGLIMVGSLIIAALVLFLIPDNVLRVLPPTICKMFGGDCEVPPSARDIDYKPKLCERSSEEKKYGAVVKVAIVKIGDEYSFLRQEMADGSVRLTVIPTNVELGLETGAGGKLSLGKNFKLGADITVGASIKVGVGDTYVFKNAEEANRFEGDIKELSYRDAGRDIVQGTSPILNNPIGDWVVGKVDDLTGRPDIKDPEITNTTISHKAGVEGVLGLYLPQTGSKPDGSDDWNFNLNTGLKIKGERSAEFIVTEDRTDPNNPKTSYFVGLEGTIGGSADILGAGAEGSLKWAGGQRLVFDKDGKLISVVFQTTFEKSGQVQGKLFGNVGDSKGSGKAKGADKTTETITTVIPIDNDADRTAMQQYLQSHPFTLPENILRYMGGDDNAIKTDPGPNANVLDRLMYAKGQTLKREHDTETDGFEVGAEAKLGLVLGAEVKYESSKNRTTKAEYLGAPRNGKREYIPYPECVS
ncbi:hypothetical protein [Spirillospora sp. NPDC047279]|uniref:hypothetical protein n=1 Tax=Spirillospora sp. NPDC047279 TaxID=3155478 RepID=UPI0033C940CB